MIVVQLWQVLLSTKNKISPKVALGGPVKEENKCYRAGGKPRDVTSRRCAFVEPLPGLKGDVILYERHMQPTFDDLPAAGWAGTTSSTTGNKYVVKVVEFSPNGDENHPRCTPPPPAANLHRPPVDGLELGPLTGTKCPVSFQPLSPFQLDPGTQAQDISMDVDADLAVLAYLEVGTNELFVAVGPTDGDP